MTSATIKLSFHAGTQKVYALLRSPIGPERLSPLPAQNLMSFWLAKN